MRTVARARIVASAGVVLALGGAAAPVQPARGEIPRVVSALPAWLAPGGKLRVHGWTRANAPVALLAGRRTLARSRSGPRGRFVLDARVRGRGFQRLVVATAGRRLPLGRLRIRPLLVAAVGDVTFGDRVAAAVRAYGPRYPWLSVAPVLRRADLATANLEGAVSTRGSPVPGKEYHFRGPPSALRAASRFAGLDVVSVANNHTLDYGRTAFLDTLRIAHRFGLRPVGGGILSASLRPAIVSAGGLRVAFLGFSDVRPLGFDATPSTPGTAPAFPDLVAASVRAARRRADATVVWFHWGIERSVVPSARQRSLGAVARAAGATVVLGAHPHVLQPIERRSGRLVAWSLGNFVFPAHSPGTTRTGILRIALARGAVIGHSFRRARIAGVQPRLARPRGGRARARAGLPAAGDPRALSKQAPGP